MRNRFLTPAEKVAIGLIVLFFLMCLLCGLGGCSNNRQHARIEAVNPQTGVVCRVELDVTKQNFLYWSKFQAQTDTFGMTTHVYNAEGKPDTEALKAFADGIVAALIGAIKPVKAP